MAVGAVAVLGEYDVKYHPHNFIFSLMQSILSLCMSI